MRVTLLRVTLLRVTLLRVTLLHQSDPFLGFARKLLGHLHAECEKQVCRHREARPSTIVDARLTDI